MVGAAGSDATAIVAAGVAVAATGATSDEHPAANPASAEHAISAAAIRASNITIRISIPFPPTPRPCAIRRRPCEDAGNATIPPTMLSDTPRLRIATHTQPRANVNIRRTNNATNPILHLVPLNHLPQSESVAFTSRHNPRRARLLQRQLHRRRTPRPPRRHRPRRHLLLAQPLRPQTRPRQSHRIPRRPPAPNGLRTPPNTPPPPTRPRRPPHHRHRQARNGAGVPHHLAVPASPQIGTVLGNPTEVPLISVAP